MTAYAHDGASWTPLKQWYSNPSAGTNREVLEAYAHDGTAWRYVHQGYDQKVTITDATITTLDKTGCMAEASYIYCMTGSSVVRFDLSAWTASILTGVSAFSCYGNAYWDNSRSAIDIGTWAKTTAIGGYFGYSATGVATAYQGFSPAVDTAGSTVLAVNVAGIIAGQVVGFLNLGAPTSSWAYARWPNTAGSTATVITTIAGSAAASSGYTSTYPDCLVIRENTLYFSGVLLTLTGLTALAWTPSLPGSYPLFGTSGALQIHYGASAYYFPSSAGVTSSALTFPRDTSTTRWDRVNSKATAAPFSSPFPDITTVDASFVQTAITYPGTGLTSSIPSVPESVTAGQYFWNNGSTEIRGYADSTGTPFTRRTSEYSTGTSWRCVISGRTFVVIRTSTTLTMYRLNA